MVRARSFTPTQHRRNPSPRPPRAHSPAGAPIPPGSPLVRRPSSPYHINNSPSRLRIRSLPPSRRQQDHEEYPSPHPRLSNNEGNDISHHTNTNMTVAGQSVYRGSAGANGGGGRNSRSASPVPPSGTVSSVKTLREYGGIKELVCDRLLTGVIEACYAKCPVESWMVLICDDPALRIISAVAGMYDIMERKVTLVEGLSKRRAPFRDMAAIYLVRPTEESVDRIIADFEQPIGGTAPYRSVFLSFLSRVPDELVAKIKKCKPLLAKIKGFGEINVDFLATEATAFSFDEPTFFHRIYSQNGSQRSPRPNQLGFSAPLSPVHVEIVDRLVSVCATLNEYPHIRYKADDIKSQRTGICPKIALLFKDRLDQFVASNPEWWYHGGPGHSERDRGVLLIVERAEDPLSPLVHEFTYRAMVHDLLEMAGEKYTYTPTTQKNASEREVLLNDNDECWVEFRDNHIAEVTEMLSGRTKEYLSNNSGAALARNAGKNMSLGQMSEALKQLPEYREIISKLSQHIHISSQCMDEFKKQNLKGIAEVEQTMVTGERENGNKVKKDVLLKELLAELRKVDQLMALRLISIYIVSQGGILAKDKEELFRVAGLSKTQRNAVANFELLGVKLERQEKKKLERLFSSRVIAKGRNDMNSEYAISRYKCYLKEVMEELVNNTLSFEKYPSILPMPVGGSSGAAASARSARTRHANHSTGPIRRSANTKMFSGGRQIVFVAGGACYSELRSVQEVMETCDKEIILGSTHFITPTSFLEDMERLSDM